MQQWKKLGQILVEKGLLTPISVSRLLVLSKRQKKRFGWTLEDLGVVTGDELAGALAEQYGLRQVSKLVNYSYTQEVLNTMTLEFALENLIFPLKFEGEKLVLAIADPTDVTVAKNFAANNEYKIELCVACRKDIHDAISKFYLQKEINDLQVNSVLVVDDDALIQTVLRDVLTKHGFRVIIAKDGIEGFKEVIANRPQVVLVDKIMPKFDGFSMLKSIKAIPETRSIPIILISDKLSNEEEENVFNMGFFDYIPKPIKDITLISRVKRAINYYDQMLGISPE